MSKGRKRLSGAEYRKQAKKNATMESNVTDKCLNWTLFFMKQTTVKNSQSEILNKNTTYPSIPSTRFLIQQHTNKMRNRSTVFTAIRRKPEENCKNTEDTLHHSKIRNYIDLMSITTDPTM
jgi:hypothetical protein